MFKKVNEQNELNALRDLVLHLQMRVDGLEQARSEEAPSHTLSQHNPSTAAHVDFYVSGARYRAHGSPAAMTMLSSILADKVRPDAG